MPSKTCRTHRASAVKQSDIPFEICNGGGAAEARDQKCTCEWRNENLACLPWRVSGLVLDTGICFIFTVDIKLQNHLINFAFTVMNSTAVDGEVRKGNTSSRILPSVEPQEAISASTRFGEALHYLKVSRPWRQHLLISFYLFDMKKESPWQQDSWLLTMWVEEVT